MIRSRGLVQIKIHAMAKKKNDRADQDSPWKRILRFNFRAAIEFFFPTIAAEIDWSERAVAFAVGGHIQRVDR